MKKTINLGLSYLFVIFVFSSIFLMIFGQGLLVSKSRAVKALKNAGFTNIEITHRRWTLVRLAGGSEGDDVRFTAEATNPIGKKVKVYIFAGWPSKAAQIKTP